MTAYVIFDVDIHNPTRYAQFMAGEAAGARYLARGGEHRIYEGDWTPRRIVLLEFPSVEAWEHSTTARPVKALRASATNAVPRVWSASSGWTIRVTILACRPGRREARRKRVRISA